MAIACGVMLVQSRSLGLISERRLPMNKTLSRRIFTIRSAGTLLTTTGLLGCQQDYPSAPLPSPEPMTPEQEIIMASRARMIQKFQGLGGVGFDFGVKVGQEFLGVMFYREGTSRHFFKKGSLWRTDRVNCTCTMTGSSIAGIPERARVVWREGPNGMNDTYIDKIIGEHSIDVGAAVAERAIAHARKLGGGLVLKFMLAPETCYFGWHVNWAPTSSVQNIQYHEIGGNFCEARYERDAKGNDIFYKGWHIDPRTGQKVETDY
jgi:hypothetical protein